MGKPFLGDLARMAPQKELSPKQADALERLAHLYRAQLGRCMATDCNRCRVMPPPKASAKDQRRDAREEELKRLLDEHNRRWG